MNHIIHDGLSITISHRKVKHLRITIYPSGEVRVVAPLRTSEATIRQFISQKSAWIHKHRAKFATRTTIPPAQYITGEMHPFLGEQHPLLVIDHAGRQKAVLGDDGVLRLYARPNSTPQERQRVLTAWYRKQLKTLLPPLIAHWESVIGVKSSDWGIKQMKTRWGTCNITAKRIWLNLELVKKPYACLEYVVVHELVHLLERYHNARFWGFMDAYLPHWRDLRRELNGHK